MNLLKGYLWNGVYVFNNFPTLYKVLGKYECACNYGYYKPTQWWPDV